MRRITMSLALVLVLLAAPAWAFFSLSGFQNSMIEFLIDKLSSEGEFEITVEEVAENSDGESLLRGLSIADSEGVWFTAETMDFAWNPSRLLRGEVEFSRLRMSGVRVARSPVLPAAEPEPADPDAPLIPKITWPRSPLTLRVEGLALTDVQIAQPLFGHALAFDATGSAQDEGDIQSVALDLKRSDQTEGRIQLSYARNFADNTLKLDLDAEEDAGGLIAAISGLPEDAASRLALRADGPPEDWRAELTLDLAETIAMGGSATIAYQGPLKIDAELNARPGPQLDPQLAALLGTEADLVAKVTEGADGIIEIEEGRITSPDLNVTAAGTYSRTNGEMDLGVDVDAGGALADPIEGVAFGGMTFAGQIRGAPGNIAADGDLVLDRLATQPVDVARAELTVDVRQSASGGPTITALEVAGQTRGLRLDQISAEVIGDADTEILAELTGSDLTLDHFWLDSNVLRLALSGTANLDTQEAELGFGIAAPDLAPVVQPYGVDATGNIEGSGQLVRTGDVTTLTWDSVLTGFAHPVGAAETLSASGEVRQQGGTIGFNLFGSGTRMRVDRIGPDLLPESMFEAKGVLENEALRIDGAVLRSPLADLGVSGDVQLSNGAARVDYKLETADLEPLARLYDQPAGGALSATGTATLPGSGGFPRVTGDLAVNRLAWDGVRYGRVDVRHDVEASASANGTISISNQGGPYGVAAASTRFSLNQPRLRLDDFDLRALGLKATGAIAVNLDGPLAEGNIAFRASDLAALRRVTGADLGGRANGTIRLATSGGRQSASLDLTASGLSSGGLQIGAARAKAALSNLLGTPSVNATMNAESISTGGVSLRTLDAKIGGPLSGLNFEASTTGEVDARPLTAEIAGRANATGQTITATLARARAMLADQVIALNAPLRIASRGGTLGLKGLDLSLPSNGNLTGDVTSHGGPVSGALRLTAPDLTFLKDFADIPLARGGVTAALDFDTRRNRATGTVTGRNVVFEGIDATGALALDATLDWQGRSADVAATIAGDFGDPLEIRAK
ncbi:MAG: hypothetical protein AB8B85_19030, partial [Paracoccaceae bacterium]